VNLFGSEDPHLQPGRFSVVVIGRETPHNVLNVTQVAGDADDLQLVPQQKAAASDKLPARQRMSALGFVEFIPAAFAATPYGMCFFRLL